MLYINSNCSLMGAVFYIIYKSGHGLSRFILTLSSFLAGSLLNLDYYALFLQESRKDMKQNYTNILIAGGLILMAAAARIVNAEMHLYNFAPVAALGLFSGAVIKDKRYAFLFAVLAQFLGDLYFQLFTETKGFYGISQFFTYGGLIAVTALGASMKQKKALTVLGYTISASVIFFIISNLGHFAQGWNGYSWGALVKTYVDAIPFFKNSLIGDLAGSVLLFGGYYLLQQSLTAKVIKSKA